jgi:hypothetical protein
MFNTNQQIFYKNNQPITGVLLNDELTMPLNKESANNGNEDYLENTLFNDINQQNNSRDVRSQNHHLERQTLDGNASVASTYNSTSSNAKELEMSSDRVSNTQLIMQLNFEQSSGTQATDLSPDGNNQGILHNGATFKNSGSSRGSVVSFDGINDYIHVNDSDDINSNINAKRTVSLWFKVDDKNISDRKQVLFEEGGNKRGLNIYVHSGRLYVGAWNNEASESNWQGTYLATGALSSNKWHHVTLVLNAQENNSTLQAGALTAYLDGVKFGTGQGSQLWSHRDDTGIGAVNKGTQFHDGDVNGTGTNAFKGEIDEVKVYNRALAGAEIAALANANLDNNPPELGDWSLD